MTTPNPLRRRVPCAALRARPWTDASDSVRVARYWAFADRLPNGLPRDTRFVGEAAVRLPGGLTTLVAVVTIGGTACMETEGAAWDRYGHRVPYALDDHRLAGLLRQIERAHVAAQARQHSRGAGRN